MPIDIRLTAVPAAGDAPLETCLATASGGGAPGGLDIAVGVPVAEGAAFSRFFGAPVADMVAACEMTGRAGEIARVVTSQGGRVSRVLFLALGDGSPADLRKAGAALGRCLTPGRRVLAAATHGLPDQSVRAFAEGLLVGSYRFSLGSAASAAGEPAEVRLLVAGGESSLLAAPAAMAGAVGLARDLANMPSNRKSPGWLAAQAVQVAEANGLRARVWEAGELAAHGFGGLLAVGAGSAHPPRLIELEYQPPGWRRHVVLAGKGITFDSGGISLKPADGMKQMKTDMAGGAAVIAVMSALGRLGVTARVTGLVAAAENMPSGSALRPGDVITHFGGRTTEVLNTDAEGRLVLADALAYADKVLQADVVVDIATLTGAARVALGATVGALYASDDNLAEALVAAGAESGEPLWRMPLADDYAAALESGVADLANVPGGKPRVRAGSIEAALFLREFTGGRAWAHLDVAGPARSESDEDERAKGATGFGARALLRWLASTPTRA